MRINSALADGVDVSGAAVLKCNDGYCYTGQYPRHKGFMLTTEEATGLLADTNNATVVRPFLVGDELLTTGRPERAVIDFQTRTILEARAFAMPFAWVQREVLPHVQALANVERAKTGKLTGQDQSWLQTWWQHFRPRPELIGKISSLPRYLVCSRVTKRPIFAFVSSTIRPGDALSCFAFADDYSFGILQSSAHWQWFIAKCSKLKSDFRYTPESVFDTFPWPQAPTEKQIDAIAAAGREIRRIRDEALQTMTGGLRALYRTLDLPGRNPLRDAHARLDATVLAAYGFSAKADLLQQLLDLNRAVAAKVPEGTQRAGAGDTVIAPGLPPSYPDPARLLTPDCLGANPCAELEARLR
ncbi:MAG: type IIL restriction-modification enzyme MmeI [Sulfuritalea sp.]|nr:type IIL restriction-modification enzyme MmeI [Sulfuritalea sp.]